MPPMGPPPGMPPWLFFCGISATIASVVIRSPATDAAPWIAERTALAGSITPLLTRLPYSASLGVEAPVVLVLLEDLADNDRAVFAGIGRDLARRGLDRLADDVDAGLLIVVRGS